MMISQVIRIGSYQPLDMMLKLADEESKKEQLFRHATGYNYQMYSSVFLGWV